MVRLLRVSAAVLPLLTTSCAALYNIDDPPLGVIAKDQLPAFQKAVRCELVTFFQANKQRRELFDQVKKKNRSLAVERYTYFDLDPTLFGSASLDLKVLDTVGLPSSGGTNITNKFSPDSAHSKSWVLGPSLTDQNTYEWQYIYLVPQNATLYGSQVAASTDVDQISEPEPFQCYRAIPESGNGAPDFQGLALGQYPQFEQFTRIRVNGTEPFAAWLQDNGSLAGTTRFAKDQKLEEAEQIIPVQMYYNFSIQISGGLNASFSLVSTRWNPVAPTLTASQQQTSNLQIWLNGPDAALAAGAKSGTALTKNLVGPLTARLNAPRTAPYGCTPRGCLLAPVPLNGPGPSPAQPNP